MLILNPSRCKREEKGIAFAVSEKFLCHNYSFKDFTKASPFSVST